MGHVLKDLDSTRGAQVEFVDTRKVNIAGLHKVTIADDEKFLVRKGAVAEIDAMLTDPDAFFAKNDARSNYNLNNIINVLHHGIAVPGKFYRLRSGDVVMLFGQHRWSWVHLIGMVLRGEKTVEVLRAEIAKARAEKGDDVMPTFPMLPAGTKDIDSLRNMVDVENFGHQGFMLTTADRYESAMRRVAAAESNGRKPDLAAIASSHGVAENTVKQWMRLRECPPSVIANVMEGKVPVSSVLTLKDKDISPAKFAATVKSLVDSGNTTVTAARATKNAQRAASDNVDAEGDGRPAADETGATDTTAPTRKRPETPAIVAAKPWGIRDLGKFIDTFGVDGCPVPKDSQRVIRAIYTLMKSDKGPSSPDLDLRAIAGLTAHLRETGALPPKPADDAE